MKFYNNMARRWTRNALDGTNEYTVSIMAITIKTETPEEKKRHKELIAITLKFGSGEPDVG